MEGALLREIRFCEWSRLDHGLSADVCRDIDAAAEAWRILNGLTTHRCPLLGRMANSFVPGNMWV